MKKFIKINKRILLIMILIFTLFISGCDSQEISSEPAKGNLRVHFLDIGQGDSTLVQLPNNQVALIDGGKQTDGEFLVDYIKKLNISKIDYLIATHPHADHIGGLPEVVKNFEIGKIYMPNKTANTKVFEKLLEEIKKKNLKITRARNDMVILNEGDLKLSVLAPISEEYENINDYSIVNKLEYKDISLIFTGDAEKTSETEMLNLGLDLSSDILKVGHHGSNSSSIAEFLDKVNPKYAVISCGLDNSYGHPHKEVMERLNERNIKILRTDKMGTIILDSDGRSADLQIENSKDNEDKTSNITNNMTDKGETYENKEKTDINSVIEEKTYVGNKNSKVYHDEKCNSLPVPENRISFKSQKEAENAGYKPHSVCIK